MNTALQPARPYFLAMPPLPAAVTAAPSVLPLASCSAPEAQRDFRTTATIAPDGHGGAFVTIGTIGSPYANYDRALAEIEALAARGLVRLATPPSAIRAPLAP